ncbi:MAG: Flp pilus assembly protein CpaB [Chloroflexi bacterium]|nr:Flp pilus assembly protein CpaB [Chloroflexota bacterium]
MIKNLAIGGGSNRALLLLALVLGVVSAVLVGVFLSQAGGNGGGTVSGVTKPAVVASRDIPANTRITADMVTVKNLPEDAVLANVLTDSTQAVGKVTQVPLAAGEQVLPAKVTATAVALAQFGDNPPLSFLVPEGKRAFAIRLSDVASVGGLLRPGDYVDIILTRSAPGVEEGFTFLTPGAGCYVVQDVEVLAVGTQVKKTTTGAGSSGVAAASTDVEATAATLAVTPDEAWWLAAAQQSVDEAKVENQLWVSVRPFGEHGQSDQLPICGVIPGA